MSELRAREALAREIGKSGWVRHSDPDKAWQHMLVEAGGIQRELAAQGFYLVDAKSIETLRKAYAIGMVSYDGDPWFAQDAGYGYDEAEVVMTEARAILAALPKDPA